MQLYECRQLTMSTQLRVDNFNPVWTWLKRLKLPLKFLLLIFKVSAQVCTLNLSCTVTQPIQCKACIRTTGECRKGGVLYVDIEVYCWLTCSLSSSCRSRISSCAH